MNRDTIGVIIVGLSVFGSIVYVAFDSVSSESSSTSLHSYSGYLDGESGPTYDEVISPADEEYAGEIKRLEEEISILEDEKYELEQEVTYLEDEIHNIKSKIIALTDDVLYDFITFDELIDELYLLGN